MLLFFNLAISKLTRLGRNKSLYSIFHSKSIFQPLICYLNFFGQFFLHKKTVPRAPQRIAPVGQRCKGNILVFQNLPTTLPFWRGGSTKAINTPRSWPCSRKLEAYKVQGMSQIWDISVFFLKLHISLLHCF